MNFRTIVAQQKGNVVKDRVFTVGDRTVQTVARDIEDYQVERRRFFWVVDPTVEFPNLYPNIDVLDNASIWLRKSAFEFGKGGSSPIDSSSAT